MIPKDVAALLAGASEHTVPVLTPARTYLDTVEVGVEDYDNLAGALGALADAAREESWRLPLGESGILDRAVDILSALKGVKDDKSLEVRVELMRLIGNCCADADPNRERVFARGGLAIAMAELEDDDMVIFAISVLYNMLNDYVAGQKQAIEANLTATLIDLVGTSASARDGNPLCLLCRLVSSLLEHEEEKRLADPAPPLAFFRYALDPNFALASENPAGFVSLLSAAVDCLDSDSSQKAFLSHPPGSTLSHVRLVVDALEALHRGLDRDQFEDGENGSELEVVEASMLRLVADLTNVPELRLGPPFGETGLQISLKRFLASSDVPALQTAACLALGNMIRSDEAAEHCVLHEKIHLSLVRLLEAAAADPAAANTKLVHSALGLLRNLAIPASLATRKAIGQSDLLSGRQHALARLWAHSPSPDIQLAAVGLARLLLTKCPGNVGQICDMDPPTPLSPVDSGVATDLQALLDLHEQSDKDQIRLEAARAIGIACRSVHSAPRDSLPPAYFPDGDGGHNHADDGHGEEAGPLAIFHRVYNRIPAALVHLVGQEKYPILRCEAWLVLAVMAKSALGAAIALRVLDTDEARVQLVKAATEPAAESGEVQEQNAEGQDENAEDQDGNAEDQDGNAAAAAGSDGGKGKQTAAPDKVERRGEAADGGEAPAREVPVAPAQEIPIDELADRLASLGTSRKNPAPTIAMFDRQNVLVLLHYVLKNANDADLSDESRAKLTELKEKGTVLAAREEYT